MVGRGVAPEEDERGVAVAAGHVAEDLIVGAVLLDDVDDVLEGRVAVPLRERIPAVRRVVPAGGETEKGVSTLSSVVIGIASVWCRTNRSSRRRKRKAGEGGRDEKKAAPQRRAVD